VGGRMSKILKSIASFSVKKPKTIIAIVIIITLLSFYFMSMLNIEMSWTAMAPEDDSAIIEYNRLLEEFEALSSIIAVIEIDDPGRVDEYVDTFEKEILKNEYVKSVISGYDRDFMFENLFLMLDEEDLKTTGAFIFDLNIGILVNNIKNTIEAMKKELEENKEKYINDKDMHIEMDTYLSANIYAIDRFFGMIQETLNGSVDEEAVKIAFRELLTSDRYIRSEDGKKIIAFINPTFSTNDVHLLMPAVNSIEESGKKIAESLEGVSIRMTGFHVLAKDEAETMDWKFMLITLIALTMVLLILYYAFRIKMAPLFAGIPLVIALFWTYGLAQIIAGRLNMITAYTAIIIIGLGIDFSIHILAGFTERRARGINIKEALIVTVEKVGPGIFIGGLTTAAAFLTLCISSLKVLQELGIMIAIGLFLTIVLVYSLLPAIIVLFKKDVESFENLKSEFKTLGKVTVFLNRKKMIAIPLIIIILAGFLYAGRNIPFDLDYRNMEPRGLDSIALMDEIVDDFRISNDNMFVGVSDMKSARELKAKLLESESIKIVMSISDYIKEDEEQAKNISLIKEIRGFYEYSSAYKPGKQESLISDIKAINTAYEEIKDTFIETGMEKSKNALENIYSKENNLLISIDTLEKTSEDEYIKLSEVLYNTFIKERDKLLKEKPLTINDLPDNIKKQYISEDGGTYLVNIFASFDVWDDIKDEKGKQFIDEIRSVDSRITGLPVFMRAIYDSVREEAVKSGLILLGALILILFIFFRSVKKVLITIIPLIATVITVIGIMGILGIEWNMINVIAIPLIIGIGVDDAVHVMHRLKDKRTSLFSSFSSVGRAIFITSLTTMTSFGSMIFTTHRGMSGMGLILFLGVGMAFIYTVILIPLLIKDKSV
jgi:predicted RND superfamily exporter protein